MIKLKNDICIRASFLARVFYLQEFQVELTEELIQLFENRLSDSQNVKKMIKIVWCMNKAELFYLKKPTLDFQSWIKEIKLNDIINDYEIIVDEIVKGFFLKNETSKKNKATENKKENGHLTHSLFCCAKRIGLSLDELNEMSMQTFNDVLSIYAADNSKSNKKQEKEKELNGAEAVNYWR